jgi:dipeptidyl aminopeptidase/acylaminoacyl peptidase
LPFVSLSSAVILSFTAGAFAQENPAAARKKPVTPEAFLEVRSLQDPQFSPDGRRVAFVVTDPLKSQHRTRHIWMYDTRTKVARQFTYSEKSESSPRWSPDGTQLAFLSNRGGEEQQIYLMRAAGGEAAAVTKGKSSVQRLEWSPDGREIAYLAPDPKTEAEEKKEKEKDDARVVDKDDKHPRLRILDLTTHAERVLTPATWAVKELVWLPDGQTLIVRATNHPESDQLTDKIYSVNAKDGKMKELLAPRGPFNDVRVSPNGHAISFVGCREDGPEPHDLMLLQIGAPAPSNLTGASLDRQVMDYRWLKDESLLLDAVDGFRTKFHSYTAQGVQIDAGFFGTNPRQFSVSGDGTVAFIGETAVELPELWIWKKGEAPEPVTRVNDAFERQYALQKPEIYKYKSLDGTEIEAALLLPAAYDGKSKLPLIALVHGGPTGAWLDDFNEWGQLLVAQGFAVFTPNIRGSIGYGQRFIEKNRADWGGGDFKDVMAGIDDLIAKGIADPEKLGIGGWSYGGYMAEWAVTQTTRFKAAVSGAGMADLISEFGTERDPAYDEWFWGVPYERPEGFLNHSPFVYMKNAKTPTLILQGEADTTDPIGQSQELYRGLKRYGVPSDFVVYPREPHGLQEAKHRVDMQKRMVEWFQKYLSDHSSNSVKKSSQR